MTRRMWTITVQTKMPEDLDVASGYVSDAFRKIADDPGLGLVYGSLEVDGKIVDEVEEPLS